MEVKPITLREANAYVEAFHRHHGPTVGHKWSLAAYKDGRLCGVAVVGRPTGSISVEIDARIVCDLAEQFKAQPGAHFDIGPGGEPID